MISGAPQGKRQESIAGNETDDPGAPDRILAQDEAEAILANVCPFGLFRSRHV
jgi:hypothetical protein